MSCHGAKEEGGFRERMKKPKVPGKVCLAFGQYQKGVNKEREVTFSSVLSRKKKKMGRQHGRNPTELPEERGSRH